LSRARPGRPAAPRLRITGGAWRGIALAAPPGLACRPTLARVREALFARLGGRVEGACVVDLFAGSGSLGLEALSRGARRAVFVEIDSAALAALRRNLAALGAAERAVVHAGDAGAWLGGPSAVAIDLALADPPYGFWSAAWAERLARAGWAPRALAVLETSRREPEPAALTGWRRWPERRYGETRITIDEREEADDAGTGS
jgi:16S rRNA (guanine966-N2)-methyltransferase